ncbi:hypothetical protein ALP83_200128 [Pseudomonas syringae pv. actinidiae]|uniref:Uncharacterized protein n=1 Tax=Pseudomonas syringae pv. actinidiae TaxID=103796 RepID=A0A7Z6Y207_PSESF|nr:deaminase domain-containing protein [Pseudomonas syringae]RMR54455.1 hypothetical protein ALP83_200128 [Pseudomonas syringae pv. actinidiae]
MDNNWLATQQIVQANKEFAAASSLAEQMSVIFKWSGISARQDFISGKGLLIGLKDGLADSGLTSLDSAAQLVAHPIESFAAMKDFVESASGRQLLGAATDALALQLAKINTSLQEGGDENAEQLGATMGQAISIVVGALAGGQTNTAKAAAELSRMGIDLSSSTLKTAAASYKASSLEKKLAKLESVGRDLDVPDAPEMPGDSVSSSVDTVRDGAKATGTIADGERLVYLSNSTAPGIRDRLSAAVSDVRTGLPREGNVAFAEVDVGALSSETMVMKAYSQFDARVEEFLPKPSGDLSSWILKPQVSTSKYVGTAEGYLRDMDTEFKILETLAQRLGPNSPASGRINLISEKMVCPSCTNIVTQFRERYPNIQLNVFTVEK